MKGDLDSGHVLVDETVDVVGEIDDHQQEGYPEDAHGEYLEKLPSDVPVQKPHMLTASRVWHQ